MKRRNYLYTVAGIAFASGCVTDTDDEPAAETQDDEPAAETQADTDSTARIQHLSAGDIRKNDDEQSIRIGLADVTQGETISVAIDISSLSAGNVGIAESGLLAEMARGHGNSGWTVTDADISTADPSTARLFVTVETDESADASGQIQLTVTELHTESIDHVHQLEHSATILEDPDGDTTAGETTRATYDVIDPAEVTNILRISPQNDISIGDSAQEISVVIADATDTIEFRMDLSVLTDHGVSVSDADVSVKSIENELQDDMGAVEVTDDTVTDGIVHLDLTTEAEVVSLILELHGLNTEDAIQTDGLAYQVYEGERPAEPTESGSFSISGVRA